MDDRLWAYCPGGVISADGLLQVDGVDRTSYMARIEGRVAMIPCEHFTNSLGPSVEFYLSRPITITTIDEKRPASPGEVAEIRILLAKAMPLIGRTPMFA